MLNQSETINFLTNAENLAPVMEIVQHAEAIRAKALSLFWTGLADRLHSTIPAALAGEKLFWEAETSPSAASSQFAGITLCVGGIQTRPQELHFRIEQTNDPKYFELYFGLHWKKEIPESSVMATNEPTLMELRSLQEENGFTFDKNPWWWGWKFFREDSQLDEFLLEFSRSPGMIAGIATTFWSYVEVAHNLVVRANEAIALSPRLQR